MEMLALIPLLFFIVALMISNNRSQKIKDRLIQSYRDNVEAKQKLIDALFVQADNHEKLRESQATYIKTLEDAVKSRDHVINQLN